VAATRQADAQLQETREALLGAGLRLADDLGLRGLSVNAIVAEASRSKGAFFHYFPTRQAYLVELHRRFHDGIVTDAIHATANMPPGRERLLTAASVYLDAWLARRGVRAFLLDARSEPAIRAEISNRYEDTAKRIEPDFKALGYPDPHTVARLWVAMIAEAAIIEFETGHANHDIRRALAALTTAA
jgi:AcrR family transcriptional regulator